MYYLLPPHTRFLLWVLEVSTAFAWQIYCFARRVLPIQPVDLAQQSRGSEPVSSTLDRSQAVFLLYQAIRVRTLKADAPEAEKKEADKKIYDACTTCYQKGVGKVQVRQIIKAVAGEFRETQVSQ
jgi:hypothetical protein